jgi:signal peptidase I
MSQVELLVRTAPVPTLVQRGQEFAEAEREAAKNSRWFALMGAGASMEPLYPSGTAIVVREQSYRTLRAGMAVVFRNENNLYVAHMLVEELAAGWIATGLNNAKPDDELVTAENFVGVVQAAYASTDTHFRAEIAARLAHEHGFDRSARVAVVSD